MYPQQGAHLESSVETRQGGKKSSFIVLFSSSAMMPVTIASHQKISWSQNLTSECTKSV